MFPIDRTHAIREFRIKPCKGTSLRFEETPSQFFPEITIRNYCISIRELTCSKLNFFKLNKEVSLINRVRRLNYALITFDIENVQLRSLNDNETTNQTERIRELLPRKARDTICFNALSSSLFFKVRFCVNMYAINVNINIAGRFPENSGDRQLWSSTN